MSREDFEVIRRAPKGRASVFIPELLLVREFKQDVVEKKTVTRLTEDVFADAARKLFADGIDSPQLELMLKDINSLRHVEDFDPNVLLVAAYFHLRYPLGLNLTTERQPGTLGAFEVQDPYFENLAQDIITLSVDKKTISANDARSPTILAQVKADIISYYFMLWSK